MDKPPESAPAPAQEAPEIRRILVPTDFSACAEVALDYALRLAQPLHASVELCHVGPQPDCGQGPESWPMRWHSERVIS